MEGFASGNAGAIISAVGPTTTVAAGGADGADGTAAGIVGSRPMEGFASGNAGAIISAVGPTATVTAGGADGVDGTATGTVGLRPTEGFASGNAGAIISAVAATTTVAAGGANGADGTAAGTVGLRPTEGIASGNAGAIISAVAATTTVAAGGADGADGTAAGIVGSRPMDGFASESTGTSTPGKIGCADPVDCGRAAADVGAIVTASSTDIAGCDGATLSATATLDTAAGVTGKTGRTAAGAATTGVIALLSAVRAETGADCTTVPAVFCFPPVSGDGVALAPAFVARIPRRPAVVTEAADVKDATAGATAAVDLAAFGTVRLRRSDCVRAGATGTSCPFESSSTLVGQQAVGTSDWWPEIVGWASAPTVTVAAGSPRTVSALVSVVAGSPVVVARLPRSALAFISNSTATPSFVPKSGVADGIVSSPQFQ
jgi:hypothetical protein